MFSVPDAGGSGEIRDRVTGRCVSVLGCDLPGAAPALANAHMGAAVLDTCGSSKCGGANQKWTREPAAAGRPATATEWTTAMKESTAPGQAWRLQAIFDPAIVAGEYGPGPPSGAVKRP